MSQPAPLSSLDRFHPCVAAWFRSTLGEPTRAQTLGWTALAEGSSTLLLAPTGSGKTLAAFLLAIDRLMREPAGRAPHRQARVLYVSPMKALAMDVERNLRSPLAAIADRARASGARLRSPTIDVRTADTPAKDRARMARAPAEIIITTPESLYLMLTSGARTALTSLDTVIVDEIHTLVPNKRGAHLALSLERLEALRPAGARRLQRVGLSATLCPLDEAARLLGGFDGGVPRPVTVVDAGAAKNIVLDVEIAPLEATSERGTGARRDLRARVLDLVRAHRSTIVFVNSRRLAEHLASALNDAAHEDVALAHHGSLAREERAAIEGRLKRGELRALVATSSLELGIDMGAVDLVVQIESPPSIASGLQRIGRASHGVHGVPHGVLLAGRPQDLLACAATSASLRAGEVEEAHYPRNPLDVLAQQLVAMTAMETLSVDDAFERVRRAAPFAGLPRSTFEGVLDMLSGRDLSDDFAELRPRIAWDRARGRLEPRAGSQRVAVIHAGTIPDRGRYGVFTAPTADAPKGRRVGELDEEMVFDLREGEVFLLGASSWRADRITPERIIVSPAPGAPGKMPFWRGDRAGRTRALGARIGAIARHVTDGDLDEEGVRRLYALDVAAARALVACVREQVDATGEVPTDRTVVLERFADKEGGWRVVVLCPLGTRVLAPWALAVTAALQASHTAVEVHCTDDGMAFRLAGQPRPPPADLFLPSPEGLEEVITRALAGTALFAARFRECAARALLLPRRDPRRRTPLWAQRRDARRLLTAAIEHPEFPVMLEAYRECLREAFDLPGLAALLRDVGARRVRIATVDTRAPSPFASSVLFAFARTFVEQQGAPPAERRAQALTVDFERLRELLGDADMRRLIDPNVLREHEASLQRLSRPAISVDGLHDLLRTVGDLSTEQLRARCAPPEAAARWTRSLLRSGRAIRVRVAGERRVAALEDAAKLRDALGVRLPSGLPTTMLQPARSPMRDLAARHARTRGPFVANDLAARYGLEQAAAQEALSKLVREGRLVEGAFLPGGTGSGYCDRDVLDALRRMSLARLRRTLEPVDPQTLARFLPQWQGVGQRRRGRDALLAVLADLEGCPMLASALESAVLPARLEDYRPGDIDALCASGQIVWAGIEPLGANDARIALYRSEAALRLGRRATLVDSPAAARIREVLDRRGAIFFADLAREAGGFPRELLAVLWQMVWSGEVTSDTLQALRSRARAPESVAHRRGRARPARPDRASPPGSEGRWSLRAAPPPSAAGETDRRTAVARSLLGRYGVVTGEAAHAEGVAGGFATIYDVLQALEQRGRVRRGHFIRGRGGAQFALPGADERLRALREAPRDDAELRVLAATDPANAWGALLDWPSSSTAARPQRASAAFVVLDAGVLLGWWLDRGERPLLTFLPDAEPARSCAAGRLACALATVVDHGTRRALLVSTVDGVAGARSPLAPAFLASGFLPTSRGLLKRPAARTAPSPTPSHLGGSTDPGDPEA